mmetsp:Transcript_4320/g.17861  ORF Transcript_4320/g.17861 Transcript_4320/m.17861 type:complete len:95 (+) Transcript_4320:1066-1350(+)
MMMNFVTSVTMNRLYKTVTCCISNNELTSSSWLQANICRCESMLNTQSIFKLRALRKCTLNSRFFHLHNTYEHLCAVVSHICCRYSSVIHRTVC